jgi:hypothetical protein
MEKSNVSLYNPESFWKIDNVLLKGELHLAKVYLKLSDMMNYDQLQKFYSDEKRKGNPHPISIPDWRAIAEAGKENKDFMNFNQNISKQSPNFYTSIEYSPSESEDKIFHYEYSSEEQIIRGEFVGPDNRIKDIKDLKTLEALIGMNNSDSLNNLSNLINGTEMFLWRLNSKPEEKVKFVGELYADSVRLDLDAYGCPSGEHPALRVLIQKQ